MKNRFLAVLAITILVAAIILGFFYYGWLNEDFTPWMTMTELNNFVKRDAPHGVADFWQKNWITAAEGRWHDGTPQYRIRYGPGTNIVWGWYVDMDQASFDKKLEDNANEGYVLVYYQKFRLPDGSKRYQGVWHKAVK